MFIPFVSTLPSAVDLLSASDSLLVFKTMTTSQSQLRASLTANGGIQTKRPLLQRAKEGALRSLLPDYGQGGVVPLSFNTYKTERARSGPGLGHLEAANEFSLASPPMAPRQWPAVALCARRYPRLS
ncbi:hypothetical protein MHYP_G00136200 [Metynnis hypsauchen]